MTNPTSPPSHSPLAIKLVWAALIAIVPTILAIWILGFYHWDLSIPMVYYGEDDIWQLVLTKVLHDTGWILTNPYLGAPSVANWHYNPAAQTSALHSVLMLGMFAFIHDPIRVQQLYYLLNFPLICATTFIACRLLNVTRLPAFCVGLLFAFTTYRIDKLFYAFLANYFMVPLALVVVMWIMTGRFSSLFREPHSRENLRLSFHRLLRSRDFLLGLLFVMLTAVFDGYYAFFTLLLLGFAGFIRVVVGDWKRPLTLLPVATYGIVLIAAALVLSMPLSSYQKSHREEFFPHGAPDPALFKHSFEAEVYATSLKMLIAPIPYHRIAALGRFGQHVIETSDEARRFKSGRATVPLGTIGSVLFFINLVALVVPSFRRRLWPSEPGAGCSQEQKTHALSPGDAVLALTLFIFLCSISGGIGTLAALAFPTIRAYGRFPIFLIFVLFLGAALVTTTNLNRLTGRPRIILIAAVILATCFGLFDQTPADSAHIHGTAKEKFLADRDFVHKIEEKLPPNAMVYQYPYSQYMQDNKYYGWGSFAPIRLYLNSHTLRWSNGGAKNSPADDWNLRISQLPMRDLITEVSAVGFSGFVIDGTVLNPNQYQRVRQALLDDGYEISEDPRSKLAFVRLRNPGYRLVYERSYRDADHVVITNRDLLFSQTDFPNLINGDALKRYVGRLPAEADLIISKNAHPELFYSASEIDRGSGQSAIQPISDIRGKLGCKIDSALNVDGKATVTLTLTNSSSFDWQLGEGPYPIRIGMHLLRPNGEIASWDDGFRVQSTAYIKHGMSEPIRVPYDDLSPSVTKNGSSPTAAEFVLVQDGNAWFSNISCKLPPR